MRLLSRRIVRQSRQTQFGMTTVQTANSHRHGTVPLGILQVILQPTIQLPELAGTNVATATTLKTADQAAFPTQKRVLHAQVCHRMHSGTQLQA